MHLNFFRPANDLKDFVFYYWTAHVTDTGNNRGQALISPSGMPELIFNFGVPVSIDFPTSGSSHIPTSIIAGQLSKPIMVNLGSMLHCLCIKLKPYALKAFFKADSAIFTNKATDMAELNPEHYAYIQQELLEVHSDIARINIIENFLRQLLRCNYTGISDYTRYIINYFNTAGHYGHDNVEDTIGCSLRTFQRHIKNDIGISPKMYQRIMRFNKAYYLTKNRPEKSMQDISYTCGYYDLSHFVNEFREFTGESPYKYFMNENTYNALFAGITAGQ